jgi:phage internal scaffolding protein
MFRSAFDDLADAVSDATGLYCADPTLAQQNFADECDINTIVNNFMRTGVMPDEVSRPQFGDFSGAISDYQSALNLVLAGEEAFSELPAPLRARFHNDPVEYVSFFEDPNNRDEAVRLGLVSQSQDSSERSSKDLVEDESSPAVAGQKSSSKGGKKSASAD